MYDSISLQKDCGKIVVNLCISPSCQTQSKARETSKYTIEQNSRFSSASLICDTTLWTCSTVPCLALNPNCSSGNRLCFEMKLLSLQSTTLSKILDMIGKSDIGRYNDAVS